VRDGSGLLRDGRGRDEPSVVHPAAAAIAAAAAAPSTARRRGPSAAFLGMQATCPGVRPLCRGRAGSPGWRISR